ncbi:MAG: hypothetical protein V5786_05945 [Psychromonas sp.]
MKHILIILFCMMSFFSATSVFASNKVGIAIDQGLGVSGQLMDISTLTGNELLTDDYINAFIGDSGISADYIFEQGHFSEASIINWYLGAGVYYNWSGQSDVGVRLPLGLVLPLPSGWDIYGQASPALGLKDSDVEMKLDFAIGIRYEF